ncbi:hypothetical protein [Mesobacillus selenatarsenatis]|uniref:Uncharacterized protein n=1 Tax=Mesobacillus selenatarsenatis (strain DSM 18680 / JCM 14380 / FERM P-15431 / SF-1) TaxID=1321606 RepID=A0A0A8WXG6_MESS1|nr:hypothetical protein [Mesobacillus selenatarsenatis]GAM12323.1 hypothetical protein SAMD00020551_0455 [Mesobacillus selenatarsenatis SF-1]
MRNNRVKYYVGTFAAIVMTTLILFWYYRIPLPADDVLKGMDNVEKINFGDYRDERWDDIYNIDIEDDAKINKIIGEFSKSQYTRVPYKSIINDGRYLSMAIIHNGLQIYRVGINDQGYLNIENDATYKFTENNSTIFNELKKLLVDGNEPFYENDKGN